MRDFTHLIELQSGNFLDFADPDPNSITIEDVAHGLSLSCRFSGQCHHYYSVAEHAMLVADRVQEQGGSTLEILGALHHDDSEAFITDVPRPAKAMLPDYAILEERVMGVVLESLGFDDLPVHCALVKDADQWALAQEAGELMPSRGEHWMLGHKWDGTTRRLGRNAGVVRELWLRSHRTLSNRAAGAR